MNPVVIELDIKKLAKLNIWWTVICTIVLVSANSILQPQSLSFHPFAILRAIGLFSLLYIVLIILHEACHLFGFWVFGGVPWKSMRYGIDTKLGVAYATTSLPLTNWAMKKALLLPFWLTAIVPVIIGFSLNSLIIIIAGAFLIAGAIGDFVMYKELRKFPKDALIKDDPVQPKLYVYTKKEASE